MSVRTLGAYLSSNNHILVHVRWLGERGTYVCAPQ